MIAEAVKAGFIVKASDVAPSISKADEIPSDLTLSEAQKEYEAAMMREALLFARSLAEMPESQKLVHADKIEKRDKLARKALKLETEKPRSVLNLTLLASGTVERVRFDSDEPANETPPLLSNAGAYPVPGATDTPPTV